MTKYTIEDLWKFPCNKQSYFFFMTLHCFSVKFSTPPQRKSLLSLLSDLESYGFQVKRILIKTDLSSLVCYHKLVYEIYPHILITITSVKLPAKRHFNVYTCCDQYTLRKKISGTCFLFADISINCFDSRK